MADSSYLYDRLSVTRITNLPAGFSWTARALAQQASSNLPYSEQIDGGGAACAAMPPIRYSAAKA